MRLKAEVPALETYESFGETLASKSNDKPHRPELRRALAALLEKIVLDPHAKMAFAVQTLLRSYVSMVGPAGFEPATKRL